MTPTARSLAWLRREGFTAAVVEKWLPHVYLRCDLWRFADVLSVHSTERIVLLVQCTSIGNVSSRVAKVRSRPELRAWTLAPWPAPQPYRLRSHVVKRWYGPPPTPSRQGIIGSARLHPVPPGEEPIHGPPRQELAAAAKQSSGPVACCF
jgi:hypothetical protein